MTDYPHIIPVNESALLVEFGNSIDYAVNASVYDLQSAIENSDLAPSVIELVPSYRSLMIEYDVAEYAYAAIHDQVNELVEDPSVTHDSGPLADTDAHEIPVAYGGDFGPDLESVASHSGLSMDEVVAIHSGTEYHIFMLGFAPGFPYLGGMDERIACPRLSTPRTLVPAGSVGIAESQTGVYPNASPGGWQLIGRTPIKLFDVDADPPAAMLPGAKVKFVPISHEAYESTMSTD